MVSHLGSFFVLALTLAGALAGPLGERARPVPLVALDAGHGGSDTGASGPQGLREKDVALALAFGLKKELEAAGGLEVLLVRSGDQDLPIPQRVVLSNAGGAELLVSLHVGWSFSGNSSGGRCYFVRRGGSPGSQTGALTSRVPALIPWGDAQQRQQVPSNDLANFLQLALNRVYDTRGRTPQRVPALLFEGAIMPTVLVEVGYLSNSRDSEHLADPKFHAQLAAALAGGILAYLGR